MIRLLWKFFLTATTVLSIVFLAVGGWLTIYTWDTPDVTQLARFAPQAASKIQITDSCLSPEVTAIPYTQIPVSLRQAVISVEGTANFPVQIARTLFCNSHDRMLQRELKEMRVATELEWQFSGEQLFTIDMNRLYFGESMAGIQNAAQHFLAKDVDQLTLPQAALLAGLIRNPDYYSPDKYPERALQRRNAVLDAMLQQGTISADEAQSAKATALR